MLTRVHHINFIVRDLTEGVRRFRALLGKEPERTDELTDRGVLTASFKLGETWLVVVQPTRDDSVPGRYLAEHGEGFFLLSLETNDLVGEARRIAASGVLRMTTAEPRRGIKDWRVMDLDTAETWGAQLQLVQEGDCG